MVLRRPLNGADPALPETVALTLVDVRETSMPADGKPVHWRLLTSHCGTAKPGAARHRPVPERWTIEEFFRTLKTAGFDIEAADIGEPQAMINLVAAATIAAVTIKQLVQARDGNTNQLLGDAFEPHDRPILEAVSAKLMRSNGRRPCTERSNERATSGTRSGKRSFSAGGGVPAVSIAVQSTIAPCRRTASSSSQGARAGEPSR